MSLELLLGDKSWLAGMLKPLASLTVFSWPSLHGHIFKHKVCIRKTITGPYTVFRVVSLTGRPISNAANLCFTVLSKTLGAPLQPIEFPPLCLTVSLAFSSWRSAFSCIIRLPSDTKKRKKMYWNSSVNIASFQNDTVVPTFLPFSPQLAKLSV